MSRYSSYDDVAAVCPYYKGSTITDVRCEGIAQGCTVVIVRFHSRDARNRFRAKHCDKLPGYEKCPFCKGREE